MSIQWPQHTSNQTQSRGNNWTFTRYWNQTLPSLSCGQSDERERTSASPSPAICSWPGGKGPPSLHGQKRQQWKRGELGVWWQVWFPWPPLPPTSHHLHTRCVEEHLGQMLPISDLNTIRDWETGQIDTLIGCSWVSADNCIRKEVGCDQMALNGTTEFWYTNY